MTILSLVPQAGYKLYKLRIEGVNGKSGVRKLKAYARAFTSQFEAKKIIKQFKPDIVIGTGGYACWPALAVAAKMGIPTMLHESNSFPGMAVRKLQETVDVIMTNFESTRDLLSPKACVVNVGNPVRRDCSVLTRADARAKLGIDSDDPVEIYVSGDEIILKKCEEICSFCKGNEKLTEFKGKNVCQSCLSELKSK